MIKFSTHQTMNALTLMVALAVTTVTSVASMNATAATTTDAPPPTRAQGAVQTANLPDMRDMRDAPPPGMGPHFGGPGPRGPRGPGGPTFAAVRTIEEIAHLYRVGGHPENVLPFYRETLSQTRDPILRHHLREAIAREELKPADTSAAITTLRAQLTEDLAALPPPPDGKRH